MFFFIKSDFFFIKRISFPYLKYKYKTKHQRTVLFGLRVVVFVLFYIASSSKKSGLGVSQIFGYYSFFQVTLALSTDFHMKFETYVNLYSKVAF